jgi:hypothetical protein
MRANRALEMARSPAGVCTWSGLMSGPVVLAGHTISSNPEALVAILRAFSQPESSLGKEFQREAVRSVDPGNRHAKIKAVK